MRSILAPWNYWLHWSYTKTFECYGQSILSHSITPKMLNNLREKIKCITISHVSRLDLVQAIGHRVQSFVLRSRSRGRAVGFGTPTTAHEVIQVCTRVGKSTLMAVKEQFLRVVPVGVPQRVGHTVARLWSWRFSSGTFWFRHCHFRVAFAWKCCEWISLLWQTYRASSSE